MLIESAADVIAVIALGSSVIAYVMLLIYFIRALFPISSEVCLYSALGLFIGICAAIIMKKLGVY